MGTIFSHIQIILYQTVNVCSRVGGSRPLSEHPHLSFVQGLKWNNFLTDAASRNSKEFKTSRSLHYHRLQSAAESSRDNKSSKVSVNFYIHLLAAAENNTMNQNRIVVDGPLNDELQTDVEILSSVTPETSSSY